MAKTGFRPEQHGYAFLNSFELKVGEREEMRKTISRSADGATKRLAGNVSVPMFNLGDTIRGTVSRWIDDVLPDYYGMCGGMAFSAADHYRAGKPLPRGRDAGDIPQDNTPEGRALREYLWDRQVESFRANAPGLVAWMFMLHLPLPFAGPRWVLERTKEEFAELKTHIDQGDPWPICLIGTSRSPFDNHQVLATGYDDNGDGTGTIYVYDMNAPGREQTIRLDMRGEELRAEESAPDPNRGPLRGFFCEIYSPAVPPDLPGGR